MHRCGFIVSLPFALALLSLAPVSSAKAQWIKGDISYVRKDTLSYSIGTTVVPSVGTTPPHVGIRAYAEQGQYFHEKSCSGKEVYTFTQEYREEGGNPPPPYFKVNHVSRTSGSVGGGGTVTTPDGWYLASWYANAFADSLYSDGSVGVNHESTLEEPRSFSRISQPNPLKLSQYPSLLRPHLAYFSFTLTARASGGLNDEMPEETPGWIITGSYSAQADAYHELEVASPQYP